MTTLAETLTLANNVLTALANLINGTGAETPVPEGNTPLPTYDDQNGTWAVFQDTADTDGIYKGIYTFALDTACSQLTIQSVSGHTTPANTSFPAARYTDCNDVVHDVNSVNDLSGKQVKRFEIYSDTAFTVTLTVTAEWEEVFDFTTGQHGWQIFPSRGSYVAGQGFRSIELSRSNNETANYIFQDGLPTNTVTEVIASGTFTGDNSVTTRSATLRVWDGSIWNTASNYTAPNSPTQLQWSGEFDNDGLRVDLYMSGYVPAPDPIFTMQTLTIRGVGINPFL